MESISIWLNTKGSYKDGLALYAALPNINTNLLKLFNKGESAVNMEKLKYELKKASRTTLVKPTPAPVIKKTPEAKKTLPDVIVKADPEKDKKEQLLFHQLPAELRPDLLAAGNLFKENCLLKTQLNELLPEQEAEALEIMLKIHSNIKKNALHWQRIDYWETHRKLPANVVSKAEGLNPFQTIRRQQQLFSSISKLKKRLDLNRSKMEGAVKVADRTRIEKMIAKQAENLLKQEQELQELTALIDKRHE